MKKLIRKIYHSLGNNLFDICRNFKNIKKRIKLKNKDVTILCSDCIGGVIYSDLNIRFNSPTINLYMIPSDFIKFCENLDFYLNCELIEIKNDVHFVGRLSDIEIHFLHYKSFEEARLKWYERSKRINKDNICLILTCKDKYKLSDIQKFNQLKYRNKVVFVPQKYNHFNNSYFIKNSEENLNIKFLGTKANHFGKKLIDDFDIVTFLNDIKGD